MFRIFSSILCLSIIGAAVYYFTPGASYAVNLMPEPWQCDLPGPPASCDGGRIIGDLVAVALYIVVTIIVPAIYVLSALLPKPDEE